MARGRLSRRAARPAAVDERRADEPGSPLAVIFGDGGHPTTELAREAIAGTVSGQPGARVLDAGCGTGVLAEAAFAGGAAEVVAVDRDPRAVALTRARLRPRGQAALVLTGSLGVLLPTLGTFDLVAANLPEPELSSAAPALARAVHPGGTLLVTGIPLWRAGAVERALWIAGLTPGRPRARQGWALLTARRG